MLASGRKGCRGLQCLSRYNGAIQMAKKRGYQVMQMHQDAKGSTGQKVICKGASSPMVKFMGIASTVQLYSSLLLGGYHVCFNAEVLNAITLAETGALLSLSSAIFYGTKLQNEKIVVGMEAFHVPGEVDDIIEITTAGVMAHKSFKVKKGDIHPVSPDSGHPNIVPFRINRTLFWLNRDTCSFLDERSLDHIINKAPLAEAKAKREKRKKKNITKN